MRIIGLDFTSAPTRKKPLTLANGIVHDDCLTVHSVTPLTSFAGFDALLREDGPWIAGFDFAFGQPLTLIENLGFPQYWQEYVELIEQMGKREWVRTVDAYMASRPMGDKLHFRLTDRIAGAQSPMTMYFIPVGRMFYEGARRLAASTISVMPNRPTEDNRVVLEVYPAMITRRIVGRNSGYKNDNPEKQSLQAEQKRAVVVDVLPSVCRDVYGFDLKLSSHLQHKMITDPTGDTMDAVLCAVQAAWAYGKRNENYGIPPQVSAAEGWIVDPELLEKYHHV